MFDPHPDCASRTIVLVGCVKSKQSQPTLAKDLYTSSLFQARRRFAERFGERWFILSALHGLVDPEQHLAPYEQVLKAGESRRWAEQVFTALGPQLQSGDRVVLAAGGHYRKSLIPKLKQAGHEVEAVLTDVPGIQVQVRRLNEAAQRGDW
ncbi:DUF6884 domain-containing protein [Deinococcus hopiensis]|uniref:DUF6884 domain-containing protein n=1 Tax=Deinococcus hopiensis KR-140 TaxID=695939 RepID=A0A1W1UVP1_9DEIO|nr:DUF6884 domain-containing protein [Deinococcus hopiensis]SMB85153.1 hypothetical protein SAMN00790413_03287 [Deinococcus hopiensis KR-140]